MIPFFVIGVFLPALNRDRCDEPDIGYTCSDLASGVEKLQFLLANQSRQHAIAFHQYSLQLYLQVFLRIMTVSLALGTSSTPILSSSQSIASESLVRFPSFAEVKSKPAKVCVNLPACYNATSLATTICFINDPIRYSALLFNPAINRVVEFLGPAGHHILANLALNLSQPLTKDGPNYASIELFDCINGSIEATFEGTTFTEFLETLNAKEFGFVIGTERGWLASLIRGIPALLYDPVSGACFKAHSYLAGGVNPLYAGNFRNLGDLARANTWCGDHAVTRRLLGNLL
jgi:hypothetical protein